jgi:transposase
MKPRKKTVTARYTIGLDLGDRRHTACVLDAAGTIVAEEQFANTRECLEAFSTRFAAATMILETGTHSPWISRLLAARGHTVHVANARKLRAISANHTKSDVVDARLLARLGRADPALLSPITHRSEAAQRGLVRLKVRESLVRARVNAMNTVRFLLKSLGLTVPSGSKALTFTRRLRPLLDAPTLALVEPLLTTIDALNAQTAILDAELADFAREKYSVTQRLQQIPGVGPLTALCFVLTLEDPKRFAAARDAGPYLGLVPRRDQSGATDKHLGITKAGHVQLRCLLVNCAHYILGPFGPPSLLRAAGLRLAAQGGKPAKKRAVIATARKLAVTLLALWKSGADYVPLPGPPAPDTSAPDTPAATDAQPQAA